jgi:ABC-type lipoprotein release transport system permease subunit
VAKGENEMIWIKAHLGLILIGIGTLILLIWIGFMTGTNKKLYNMMLDQLRTDESKVVADQKKYITDCEVEITKLAKDKEEIKKQKIVVEKRDAEKSKQIGLLTGRVNALQNRLNSIVVSDNPDRLLEDLRSRGINIKRYR